MTSLFKVHTTTHTITSWRDWSEWSRCKDGLFAHVDEANGADAQTVREAKLQAIQIVNSWRGRGHVPAAVESTTQLIQLNLQHNYPPTHENQSLSHLHQQQSTTTTLQSRLEYAMVLMRFVNGVLDPLQKQKAAASINSLAKDKEIPRMLVDLRMDATHQSLPSLPRLQLASIAALDWLYRHHWTAQSHLIMKLDDAIRHQLREYKKSLEKSKEKAKKKEAENGDDGEDEITVTIRPTGDTIMLSDGQAHNNSLLPEKSQSALRALFSTMTSGHTLQHAQTLVETKLIPLLLSEQFLIKPPKQSRVSLTLVFRRLLEIWDPALIFLAQKWKSQSLPFFQLFFTNIFNKLITHSSAWMSQEKMTPSSTQPVPTSWQLDLLREWATHLLRTQGNVIFKEDPPRASPTSSASESASKKRSHATMQETANSAVTVMLDDMMYRCLKHINLWTAPLLPLLFPIFKQFHHNSASIAKLELLLHLTTKSLYPQSRIAPPSTLTLPTASSTDSAPISSTLVKQLLEEQRSLVKTSSSNAPSSTSSTSSGLELMRDFPFLPLGLVPNQDEASNLWLEDEEWLSSFEPVKVPFIDQPPTSASITDSSIDSVAVTNLDDDQLMDVDSGDDEEKQQQSQSNDELELEHPNKRLRPSPSSSTSSTTPTATPLVTIITPQMKLAHEAALQRVQQAIQWI